MKHLPAFLVLLLACLGCQSLETEESSKTAASNHPPVAVKAETLTRDYRDNELAADSRYKGKPLEVSGRVSDIAETFGSVTVDLEGVKEQGLSLVTVKCSFPEAEKSKVAALKKGQQTTLAGVGDGMTAGLYVGMQNCRVKN